LTSQRYVRAPVRSPSSAEKPAERPEPQPTGEAASFEYEPSAAPVHTDAAPGGEVVQRKATTGPDGGLGREPVAGRAIPVRPGYGSPIPPEVFVQMRERQAATQPDRGDAQRIAAAGVAAPAQALPHAEAIQRSFGQHDVSGIRAHVGGEAARASSALDAEAFATGNDVAFRAAPDRHTAAHEAAHVIQQRGGVQLKDGVGSPGDAYEQHADAVADAVVQGKSAEGLLDRYAPAGGTTAAVQSIAVQRYEAGEHAKTGDTHDELKKAYAPIQYTVVKGDTLTSIADRFKITVAALRDANHDKLTKVAAPEGGKKIDGFNPGEQIEIPQKLNEMARDAVKDPSVKVTINGVVLDYGVAIAIGGDLFGSADEMAKAPPDELKAIAALITEEKQTGKLISTERWQAATHGRYLGLAAKNEPHFAPSNPDFIPVSGKSTGDHKQSWEDNHRKAVVASRAGDKDKALLQDAFADHFLTDAFSAGHLFNKRDVMEKFNNQLPTTGAGADREFTKNSEKFFDAIARKAFVGAVGAEFSKYETVERHWGIHPNIDSASRFSALLQGIHLEQPDLLESAVAKGIHDKLNSHAGGVMVENALGDKWPLSGDGTLNAQTLAVARRAVAQSQQNVIASFRMSGLPDYPALFKRVWDFTPRPTADGRKVVSGAITSGSDVNTNELQTAIVNLISANYLTIIAELVKLQKLRKA